MNINYEVTILVVLFFVAACFCMLVKLTDVAKGIKNRLDVLSATVNEMQCDLFDINADVSKIHINVEHIDGILNDISKWDGDEDDDIYEDEDEPEPPVEEDHIHLITCNEFFFSNVNDKFNLVYICDRDELRYYYSGPEFVVIDNVDECIGEGLKFFGINSKDPNVVYVRNNVFGADFRIERMTINDVEEVYG